MLRFSFSALLIAVVLWVIAPLLLMGAHFGTGEIPVVTIRAASDDAASWLVFASLISGAVLVYTGWTPRAYTRGAHWRRRVLIAIPLVFVWVIFPNAELSSEIVRQPPVAIQGVSPLALAWIVLASAGTALLVLKFGKQLHTQYDTQRQQQTLLTIVNDQLDEGIALFNRRLRVQWANTAGQNFLFEQNKPREEVLRLLQRAAETQRVASQSLTLSEDVRVNVQVSPLPDGSVYAIARPLQNDIDQINFYERFIRRIVHDMRNPLAAIVAHASNLQASETEVVVWQNTAVTIEKEAQRLTRLVDSMLFDARLSYVPLALENIDLIDVIENVFYQFDERATRENKSIEVETPPPPALLEADHDLLVRALSNLVDNSLKYSSAGAKIRITLEITDTVYTLKVIDTGDGIAPELLPDRMFEALVRGRAKDSGSGLGLSIVRKIVELHGGDITAQSVMGQGTTMTLSLPR